MQAIIYLLNSFQSPPSVRKATSGFKVLEQTAKISIPAFREEGDLHTTHGVFQAVISIPAFREEGDKRLSLISMIPSLFQSPPSVRKATHSGGSDHCANRISIPAFREEGDQAVYPGGMDA